MNKIDLAFVSKISDFYYRSNYGIFSEYIKFDGYDLAFSKNIEDEYYNHIIHYHGDINAILSTCSEEFEKRNRKPVLYVTPLSDLYDTDLEKEGYKTWAVDTWMMYDSPSALPEQKLSSDISVVEIGKDSCELYLDTFMKAFSNPDDVYGILPDGYRKAEAEFFDELEASALKSHVFLGKVKDDPVGVIRYVSEGDFCFMYALGVEKKYRKGGEVARILSSVAMRSALDGGARNIFLQTELRTPLERYYRIFNFAHIFKGSYIII